MLGITINKLPSGNQRTDHTSLFGKRSITPQMSIRFGALFGQSENFWHGIQVKCDFRILKKEKSKMIKFVQTAELLMVAE
jgi:plasmid maintenance system antidote protein VapI